MGSNSSKISSEQRKEIVGRGQQLQFRFNLWPEPIRKEGTTHSGKEHSTDLAKGESVACGTFLPSTDHALDTMVAAIRAQENSKARLFLYGMAHFPGSTGDERRAEVMPLTYDMDSKIEGVVRYTAYFSKDSSMLKDSAPLSNDDHKNATTLKAILTSAPDTPNDDVRKDRMQKAVSELLSK